MLDISMLRRDAEHVTERLKTRGVTFDYAEFNRLDAERKYVETQLQTLQAQRKNAAKQVGAYIKAGDSAEQAKAKVADALAQVDHHLTDSDLACKAANQALQSFMLTLPNLPDNDVPIGANENDNKTVSTWGEPRVFADDAVRDHVALGAHKKGIDFDAAAMMTGSRFAVLKGDIARLHRALAQFMLDTHTEKHGYQEVNVPLIVNQQALMGTGQLPKFEDDLFKLALDDHDYYLIPTAEVPLTNLLRDCVLDAQHPEFSSLPLKWVSHSACFRSEAGSYGRDVRGMIRQHQFEKIELVQCVEPAFADEALDTLTADAEAILQALVLPYRKQLLCTGDLGFSAQKTYDLEVWLPSQSCYREISSCSHFGDFQARRLMARYRDDHGKPQWLHTLNGSGVAVGRCLIAVMENYQQADGSIKVPEVLRPYMGGKTVINQTVA